MTTAAWLERHQVPVYLGGLAAGGVAGWLLPGASTGLAALVNPLLAALLYITFLQVPGRDLVRSLTSGRFLAALLTVNFVVAPVVVACLFAVVPVDEAVRLGVVLVLLAPCVDYVIAFSSLAGGSGRKLLAATPVLLIVQMLLLPVYVALFADDSAGVVVRSGPFVDAFLYLIAVPLLLAWATQAWAARHPGGARFTDRASVTMVPLMAATLFTVVASQVPTLGANLGAVLTAAPIYVAFLVVMAFAGAATTRGFGLPVPDARAVTFSGATRNSLVILPLALALPEAYAAAVVVIVAQTVVEVLGMVVYVRLIPTLLPSREHALSR